VKHLAYLLMIGSIVGVIWGTSIHARSLKTKVLPALNPIYGDKAPANPKTTSSKFGVTIIAISEFTKNLALTDSPASNFIDYEAGELQQFFQENFDLKPNVFRTSLQTDKRSIEHWLETFPKEASQSLNIVFILSHGYVEPYGNPQYPTELFLATSDSESLQFKDGIKGSEILNAIKHMNPGASVLLFIDACNAAGVITPGLKAELEREKDIGVRTMIVTAAEPGESAYSARFSRALLDIWKSSKSGDCTKGEDNIRSLIQKRMQLLPSSAGGKTFPSPPADEKQQVEVALPYTPTFCIESFRQGGALAIVANRGSEDFDIEVIDDSVEGGSKLQDVPPLKHGEVLPLSLNRSKYTVIARPQLPIETEGQREKSLSPLEIDLKKDYVQLHYIADGGKLVESTLRDESSDIMEAWGASVNLVKKQRLLALKGLEPEATQLKKQTDASEAELEIERASLSEAKWREYRAAQEWQRIELACDCSHETNPELSVRRPPPFISPAERELLKEELPKKQHEYEVIHADVQQRDVLYQEKLRDVSENQRRSLELENRIARLRQLTSISSTARR
jgi:hypothetical protein